LGGTLGYLQALLLEDLLELVEVLELGVELAQLHLDNHGHQSLNLALLGIGQHLGPRCGGANGGSGGGLDLIGVDLGAHVHLGRRLLLLLLRLATATPHRPPV
jgi:hypothetical protein